MTTVIRPVGSSARDRHPLPTRGLFDPAIVKSALVESVRKLHPRVQARNPVMFVVLVGSVLTTILFFRDLGDSTADENVFSGLVAAFLWFTVLFANFAEAMAEGPRQGPGGDAAPDPCRDHRPPPARRRHARGGPEQRARRRRRVRRHRRPGDPERR